MKCVASFVLVGLLVIADVANAQLVTGSLIGTVRDESGGVLPGVTATLTSPVLPSAGLTAVTNRAGEYRFPELPPGTYSLKLSLEGFKTYEEEGLRVPLGGTIERVVTLSLGTMDEAVTVSGESPMVDTRRVGTGANIPQETLENIPISRFRASELAKWTPGVSPNSPGTDSDNIRVMGSRNDENSVLYDGALNKAADDGRALQAGMADTIAEIQVSTLGASAEYQIAQGAIVNLVFKQGTNRFRWDASGYWYPDTLISKPVKLPCNCPLGETGYIQNMLRDYAGNAGGPILRDRLWFYGGFKYNVRDWTTPGGNPEDERVWWGHGTLGKLNWRASDSLDFKQTFSSTYWDTPGSVTVNRPFETRTKAPGLSHIYVSEMLATLTSNTLLTVRASGLVSPVPVGFPLTGDTITPFRLERSTGIAGGGVPDFGARTSNRHVVAGKVNRYIAGRTLTHDLRGGIQYERADYSLYRTRPSGVNYSDLNGQPDQASFRDPWVAGGEQKLLGAWVEDQLTVKRLTVSLGVRFDQLRAVSPDLPARNTLLEETGETIQGLGKLFTWNMVAPRTGFNLKLTDDGSTILRGHYGRAFRQVFSNDIVGVHPGNSPITLARWNPDTNSYSTIISVTDPTANIAVDGDMEAPVTDSFSIGFDRQLRTNLVVGATVVHKRGSKHIGWRDIGGVYGAQEHVLPDGRTLTVQSLLNSPSERRFLRTNGPGTFNRYTGLVLTLDKRFSQAWRTNLSYTYGRDRGLESTAQDPNANINADGENGRPHVFMAMGSYEIPRIGVQAVVNFMSASGDAFAPQALVQLPQGRLSVNIAKADGTYRLPHQNILNLRFAKMLFPGGDRTRRIEVGAEIRNALQETAHTDIVSANFFGTTFGQGDSWVDPRRMVLYLRGYF